MVFKLINATEARQGKVIMVDGSACTIRSIDVSKTGKHGHAKCRIEAMGIIDGKKRVLVVPGHERLEIPMIEKRKAASVVPITIMDRLGQAFFSGTSAFLTI